MTIAADSYLAMILPEDISKRIADFITGQTNFPFIGENELMCIFCFYGKNKKVNGNKELQEVIDVADHTADNMSATIGRYKNSPKSKMNSEFTRVKYLNRELQISVEKKGDVITQDQVFNDPVILSDCFAQHVAYYNQEYFFQVYGPFKDCEVIKAMREYLVGRMIMIGYNRKDQHSLPFYHPLIPLYVWLSDDNAAAKT